MRPTRGLRATAMPARPSDDLVGDLVGFVAFPVVHVPQNDAEEPVLVLESWQEPIFVVVLCHGLMADFAKAAATTLHEGHTLEQISQNGVSADALDIGVQHALGQLTSFHHEDAERVEYHEYLCHEVLTLSIGLSGRSDPEIRRESNAETSVHTTFSCADAASSSSHSHLDSDRTNTLGDHELVGLVGRFDGEVGHC